MASIAIHGGGNFGGAKKYFGGPVQTRLGQMKQDEDAVQMGGGPMPVSTAQPSAQPVAGPMPVSIAPAPQSPGRELGDAGIPGRTPQVAPPRQATQPSGPPRPRDAQPVATTVNNRGGNVNTGQMGQDLWRNARGAMNDPSRYNAKLVRQGAKVIDDTIARMRKAGTRNVGEWAAGRGLIGSSLEGERMTDLEGQLDAKSQEMLFNLRREQANTFANDRGQAFGMGLGSAGFNEGRQTRLGNEDYRNRALDQDRYFGERNADRSDLGMAADITGRFGPETLDGGVPAPGPAGGGAGGGAAAPVSPVSLDPRTDPGFGQTFGEGWWDGTPEGERAFRKYFGN